MAQSSSILSADRGRASAAAWGMLSTLVILQAALVVGLVLSPKSVRQNAGPGVTPGEASASHSGLKHLASQTEEVLSQTPVVAPPPSSVSLSPPPVGSVAPLVPAVSTSPTAPPAIGSFDAPSLPKPVTKPQQPPLTPAPGIRPEQKSPVLPSTPAPAGAAVAPSPSKANASPAKKEDPRNMSLQEMIDMAKQVRGMQDMQGALEILKLADSQFPNSPAVLAELAQCYEQMGLADKAASYWRQLETMAPAQAAGYRDLASRRLSTPTAAAAPANTLSSNIPEGPKVLSLGACQAIRDPNVTNGEKVTLRIPVLRLGNSPADPNQVDIDIFFFDRVNGEKVAQTIADEPITNWSSPPVDWSGIGEEPLEVTYFLPQLSSSEIQVHGRRSYHGYVVKLYYQHKLQDVSAEPRDLLEFGTSTPPRETNGTGNPLLPPIAN